MITVAMLSLAFADPIELDTHGEVRLIGSAQPDVVVDADGTSTGGGLSLDSRIRAGVGLTFKGFRLGTEWDLLSGQLAGATWQIPGDLDERERWHHRALTTHGFVPRELALEGRLGPMQLAVGLQTSHWGLGALANDGDQEPLFGRSDFGDRVLRLRATTAPLRRAPGDPVVPGLPADRVPLFFTLALDRVVADDLALWRRDQAAYQGTLAVLWRGTRNRALGAYLVGRVQQEDDTRHTEVGVLDLYADWSVPLGAGFFRFAGEAVGAIGHTSRASSYDARDGLAVRAGLLALEADAHVVDDALVGRLHLGWSSGDGDADDALSAELAFDRDYDVGMVLFDEWRSAVEAGASAQLTDPHNAGSPPDGVEALTSEGAVRRAMYIQPIIETSPVDWITVRAGLVVAWSTAPESNPFYAFRAGGVPRNAVDEPLGDGHALGIEVDAALIVRTPEAVSWPVRPELRLQAGHAILAGNVAGSAPRGLTLATATVFARWDR